MVFLHFLLIVGGIILAILGIIIGLAIIIGVIGWFLHLWQDEPKEDE